MARNSQTKTQKAAQTAPAFPPRPTHLAPTPVTVAPAEAKEKITHNTVGIVFIQSDRFVQAQ